MVEKDRQVVTRQEAELKRVHELDRRRRHTIGAAETNLAAKRRGSVSSINEIWHCPSTPYPIPPHSRGLCCAPVSHLIAPLRGLIHISSPRVRKYIETLLFGMQWLKVYSTFRWNNAS